MPRGRSGARSGPTVAHLTLARELVRLRKNAQVSLKQAASALDVSEMTVRRIEGADTAPDAGQISVLLTSYGATAEVTQQVMASLAEATLPGWWHPYRSVMHPWEQEVLGIESAASLIRCWSPGLIPDLLRTPAYAAAAARLEGIPENRIERRLELLAERQRRLSERNCTLWVLLPQSVLHTAVGGREIMREQYQALHSAATRPRTSLQLVPLDAPPHPLTGGPALTVLRTIPQIIPDYLVLHGPAGDRGASAVHDDVEAADHYRLLLDRSCAISPDPRTTLSLLPAP